MRASRLLWRCALVLALGGLGVLVLVLLSTRPGGRRARRAERCGVCRAHLRWLRVGVAVVATLVLVGTGMRIYNQAAHRPMPRCGTEWFLRGQLPAQRLTKHRPEAWHWTREIVTAPATGLTYGYARTRGMGLCTTGSLTIAFLPSNQATSGTTVGHIFITRGRPGLNGIGAQALGVHESRHVDQWTVLTLAGGPLALPVLYTVDEVFFPGSRNHFERGADLSDGGYDRPAGFGPKPVWPGVAVIGVLTALLARHRVRWFSRVARAGPTGGRRAEPGRCPLHSRGWFRVPSRQ